MLRRDDGLDDGCEVVDIGQCFDAEDDIVEGGARGARGLFGSADDCGEARSATGASVRHGREMGIPCLGLNRSLPNLLDLCGVSVALWWCGRGGEWRWPAYLKETPYCETAS